MARRHEVNANLVFSWRRQNVRAYAADHDRMRTVPYFARVLKRRSVPDPGAVSAERVGRAVDTIYGPGTQNQHREGDDFTNLLASAC